MRQIKKSGLGILFAGMATLALFPAQAAEPLYQGKITIGTAIWPGYFPLYVAQDKGYFKEAGLDVEVKLGVSLAEVSDDYVAGKMQGRANLVFDAVKEQQKGFDHKIILAIDYSNGADAILASKEIRTVQDFKGKRVAYEVGTLEEFFLNWVLSEKQMKLSDVVSVNANPEEAAKMLKDGQVDAAVTYEPFVSQYVLSGDIHVVYSSAEAPGVITDILTFRTDFVEAHPEVIQAIVGAYFKAVDLWKSHPEEVHAIVAKYFADTPESIAKQLKGVTILDPQGNRAAFTPAEGLQSLYGNVRQINKFVGGHNEKNQPLNTDSLIEDKFIKNIHA